MLILMSSSIETQASCTTQRAASYAPALNTTFDFEENNFTNSSHEASLSLGAAGKLATDSEQTLGL